MQKSGRVMGAAQTVINGLGLSQASVHSLHNNKYEPVTRTLTTDGKEIYSLCLHETGSIEGVQIRDEKTGNEETRCHRVKVTPSGHSFIQLDASIFYLLKSLYREANLKDSQTISYSYSLNGAESYQVTLLNEKNIAAYKSPEGTFTYTISSKNNETITQSANDNSAVAFDILKRQYCLQNNSN
jgi:hypothetical protein